MRISLVQSAVGGLANFVHSGMQQQLEPIRLAKTGYALMVGGCSEKGPFPGRSLASHIAAAQHHDGGWADVEETVWCLGYLATFGHRYDSVSSSGRSWLASVRLPCGAWGKSNRDQPRIPVTALASALVRDAVDSLSLQWLDDQWRADLTGAVQLTYKGAFFLVSQAHVEAPRAANLVDRTLEYLTEQQEEDGGFGPWKGHPVGSDPWTTGVVLWGLSGFSERVSTDVLERAVSWLQSKQLPNGLWPYHYIDDGSSMALIGLSKALPILSKV